ncbi:DUF4870 family protein [Thermodesulfovibrio hydrogeniphilus]
MEPINNQEQKTQQSSFDKTMENVFSDAKKWAWIVYFCYLGAILLGVTAIVGVVMAYIQRGNAAEWLKSHFSYQIKLFWVSILLAVLFMFVGFGSIVVLPLFPLNFVLYALILAWFIYKNIKGMMALSKNEAIAWKFL